MQSFRRDFLRTLGAGAALTVAGGAFTERSLRGCARIGPLDVGGPIRLDRNEDSYGPSAETVDAMRQALAASNRYPDVAQDALRERIASLHRVGPEQVILGCGSGEILRMSAHAFLGRNKTLTVALPSFPQMTNWAQQAGATVLSVPLRQDHAHDLDGMVGRSGAGGLVYICNPNNPTATLTPRRRIEAFLRELPPTTHVVIDEAYHHYVEESADYDSFIDDRLNDPRVIVTRTFSKIYGLAGLRIGYAVTARPTARLLESCRLSGDVNVVGAMAALAALGDVEHVRQRMRRNADERQEFFNQANARMLRVIDSQASFVMLNTERSGVEVVRHFASHGLLLPAPFPNFEKYVRVSLGRAEEMQQFWRLWDLMPMHKMAM